MPVPAQVFGDEISPARLRRIVILLCPSRCTVNRISPHVAKGKPRLQGPVSTAAITLATSTTEWVAIRPG